MGLVEDLNRISAMQGKAPIDPARIQGAGEWTPPAVDPDVPAEWLDPEIDLGEDRSPKAPPSPLIPRRSPLHPKPTFSPPKSNAEAAEIVGSVGAYEAPPLPVFSLCVADTLASWKQRSVTLTTEEEASIRAIVLKAIQREVQADLEQVEKPRTRKPRATSETTAEKLERFAAGNLPARRKPGRPKKTDQK